MIKLNIEQSAIKILSESILKVLENKTKLIFEELSEKIDKAAKIESVKIKSVKLNNMYEVELNGKPHLIRSNNNKIYSVGEIVWVLLPSNNYNDAFIL